jgi:hypothetical protein
MDAPSWSQLLLNSKVSYGLAAKFPRARLYTRRNVRRVWNGIALRAAALTPLLSPAGQGGAGLQLNTSGATTAAQALSSFRQVRARMRA